MTTSPGTGSAQNTPGLTLEDLLQRIDGLERRNKALETQVTELKALEGEKWLSQERADQIRGIVADVVADAEARASLRGDTMTAGWNDGFFLASPDGRFKLQVGGLVQPRFMWSHVRNNQYDFQTGRYSTPYQIPDLIEDRYGFDSNYNELVFKGHVFSPAVEYMVRTNVALGNTMSLGTAPDNFGNLTEGPSTGQLYLMDAWTRIAFSDNWSLRFGQYRSPYAREQMVTEANQMAVSRSTVVRNFGLWYTQGLELQFQGDDFRWNLSVDNGGTSAIAGTTVNLVGVSPLDQPWWVQSVQYSVTTRLEWKPFGAWKDFTSMTSEPGGQQGMLLGVAYHTQATRPDQTVTVAPGSQTTIGLPDNYWDAVTADLQWNFGGASIFASAYYNYVNSQTAFTQTPNSQNNIVNIGNVGLVNAYGVVLQPSVYFLPKWEWYTRYEYGYVDIGNASRITAVGGSIPGVAQQQPYNVITTGVNWYIDGQDLKWTFDMGFNLDNVGYSWQNLPAGWRISGSNQLVMRTQLQLQF